MSLLIHGFQSIFLFYVLFISSFGYPASLCARHFCWLDFQMHSGEHGNLSLSGRLGKPLPIKSMFCFVFPLK